MKPLFPLLLVTLVLRAQIPVGSLEGRVLDAGTQAPLVGVNVLVGGTALGAVTGPDGRYAVPAVPVGNYTLHFRLIGYSSAAKTDIIVRSQRITVTNAELAESVLESEQVTVTAGYFRRDDVQMMNAVGLSREEIRRAPGSGGDVSRIIMGMPSVAKVNDQSNALIVRGGSPLENAFYIDGIEVPNINHFPTQGATGGPIGMVNVDLIDEVNFHTGGFSPSYGGRMSSILDIRFREGNRREFDGQLDLNIAGFGGVAEGPLGEHGSYLFSLRRSYLDLVMSLFDVGTTVAPNYGDVQGKVVLDLSPAHTLSVMGLFGDDHNAPDLETARENDMLAYGRQDIYQGAGGAVWRALWSASAYSTVTLGYLSSSFDEEFTETSTGILLMRNRSAERSLSLRGTAHITLSPAHAVEFGAEAKRMMNEYDNAYGAAGQADGTPTAAAAVATDIAATTAGAYANWSVRPFTALSFTLGARADWFSQNDRVTFSPRASLALFLDELTTFRLSSGLYRQNLPLLLLAQEPSNASLSDPYAVHYIAGIDRLLSEDTKLTVEYYLKEYYDYPVDPADPALFLVDEVFYRYGFFLSHGPLASSGRARSQGVELTLQKKLAAELYGMASVALFRSEYQGADGAWRNRMFDNRVIVSAEGGYKPGSEWEFSARWIYAGGTPYTPFDIAQSQTLKRGVFDAARVNGARYPAYHSMNVRFDRRFHFESSNLVLYLSAWNVYDRKNVASYFWNERENEVQTIYQWNLLPIFGVEYEM